MARSLLAKAKLEPKFKVLKYNGVNMREIEGISKEVSDVPYMFQVL